MDLESERKRQIAEGFQSEATRIDRSKAEADRVARWHATRDAALTGILTGCEPDSDCDHDAIAWATRKADAAHGKLKP